MPLARIRAGVSGGPRPAFRLFGVEPERVVQTVVTSARAAVGTRDLPRDRPGVRPGGEGESPAVGEQDGEPAVRGEPVGERAALQAGLPRVDAQAALTTDLRAARLP